MSTTKPRMPLHVGDGYRVAMAKPGAKPIDMPTEYAFIRFCLGDWLEPEQRDEFVIEK